VLHEEVARAAGADSLEFRRSMMQNHPKHLGVLKRGGEKAGWGKPLPAGVHRGIAQFMATAATRPRSPKSREQGRQVKGPPHGVGSTAARGQSRAVAAQVEGSAAYGLSAAFYGEMSVEKGRMWS